jgi:hypothetical protein
MKNDDAKQFEIPANQSILIHRLASHSWLKPDEYSKALSGITPDEYSNTY